MQIKFFNLHLFVQSNKVLYLGRVGLYDETNYTIAQMGSTEVWKLHSAGQRVDESRRCEAE